MLIHFQRCTGTQNLSWDYLDGLYVKNYTTRSQVQTLNTVQLSPRVKTAGNCPEDLSHVSGCSLSVDPLSTNPESIGNICHTFWYRTVFLSFKKSWLNTVRITLFPIIPAQLRCAVNVTMTHFCHRLSRKKYSPWRLNLRPPVVITNANKVSNLVFGIITHFQVKSCHSLF